MSDGGEGGGRRRRTRNAHQSAQISRPAAPGHRRACASPVASFAVGVAVWKVGGAPSVRAPTGKGCRRSMRFATSALSHCRAHRQLPSRHAARCGAFADERRGVAGDGGGRKTISRSSGRQQVSAYVAAGACLPVERWVTDERARPWSRRSARALRFARRSWRLPLRSGALIATFRCAAPARWARSPMSVASWLEWMTALHTGALIATFGCASALRRVRR